jgi:calcineurin-like phosphoesterase family protein
MSSIKIELSSSSQNIWITSDTHYGHKNICRGVTDWRLNDGSIPIDQTRDFESIDSMNASIVNNINEFVNQDDILFHLGDWSFGGFENIRNFWDRIVCKNIHLILGNHDHNIERNRGGCKGLFKSVNDYVELSVGGKKFVLMHYPLSSWNGLNKGVIHLHGHVHLPNHKKFGKGRKMDVGIDGSTEFRPYNLIEEIIPIMIKRNIISDMEFDHHTDELKNVVG